jgi:hypothetical protein
MNKENIIKKITISIGDTEAEVTPEQARKLHAALSELLNIQPPVQTIEKHIHHHDRPWFPYITWPSTIRVGTPIQDPNKWKINYLSGTCTANLQVY